MSATGRAHVGADGEVVPASRIPLDDYRTPEACALGCVQVLGVRGLDILEPHVGAGAWARAAKHWGARHVVGIDLNPLAEGFDACDTAFRGRDSLKVTEVQVDWILGNPPYDEAEVHIRHALELRPRLGVAFLLRLNFLGGKARAKGLWQEHWPDDVLPVVPRPSFAKTVIWVESKKRPGKLVKKTRDHDSCEYGLFVWRTGIIEAQFAHASLHQPIIWK